MNEFADLERRLAQYQPAAPSDEARRRMASLLHRKPGTAGRRARFAALALAIAGLATVPWWVHRLSRDSDGIGPVPEDFANAWAGRPREPVAAPPTHAQVVVVVFNDWLCITCATLYPEVVRIIESFERTRPGRGVGLEVQSSRAGRCASGSM